MIFGIPVGTQTVHLSVDTTDIGKYSMTPASMMSSLGYSSSLFSNNGTKIKESDDLNDLPNIETQDISVDVLPFWGNEELFEIGITRQDFRIRATLTSTFTIFGSTMTMGEKNTIGNPDIRQDDYGMMLNISRPIGDVTINDMLNSRYAFKKEYFRTGKPIIDVFTISTDVSFKSSDNEELVNFDDVDNQIIKLDKLQYYEYVDNDGNFILIIPCNRRRVIFDNLGNEEIIDENRNDGILTRFYGMITVDYENLPINKTFTNKFYYRTEPDGVPNINRARLKIPQNTNLYGTDKLSDNDPTYPNLKTNVELNNNRWRKSYKKFNANLYYSIAQFLPVLNLDKFQRSDDDSYWNFNEMFDGSDRNFYGTFDGLYKGHNPPNIKYIESGITNTLASKPINIFGDIQQTGLYFESGRDDFDMLNNKIPDSDLSSTGATKGFGGQWMNMCLLLPQYVWADGYEWYLRRLNAAPYLHDLYNDVSYKSNNTKLFAGLINSERFIRGDYNQTAFIEIPKEELIKFYNYKYRALNIGESSVNQINLIRSRGELLDTSIKNPGVFYRRPKKSTDSKLIGDDGFRLYGEDDNVGLYGENNNGYFFKGLKTDCVKKLYDLGFVI